MRMFANQIFTKRPLCGFIYLLRNRAGFTTSIENIYGICGSRADPRHLEMVSGAGYILCLYMKCSTSFSIIDSSDSICLKGFKKTCPDRLGFCGGSDVQIFELINGFIGGITLTQTPRKSLFQTLISPIVWLRSRKIHAKKTGYTAANCT